MTLGQEAAAEADSKKVTAGASVPKVVSILSLKGNLGGTAPCQPLAIKPNVGVPVPIFQCK